MMEKKIRRLVAPKERRTPISWMRWRTVTIEMFTRLRAPRIMMRTPAAVTTLVKPSALRFELFPRLSLTCVEPFPNWASRFFLARFLTSFVWSFPAQISSVGVGRSASSGSCCS